MNKKGATSVWVIVVIVIIVLGWFLFSLSGGNTERVFDGEVYTVEVGSFDVSVPTSGELVAENQINIYNHLESGATII